MKTFLASVTAALLLGATPAAAAIVSGVVTDGTVLGSGTFVKLDPALAFSVGQNNFNTNNLYALDEAQSFTLTSDQIANLGLTSIAAGTKVNSHYVFFDPLATQTLRGTLTFDTPVIAAITLRPALIASNYLGAAGVTYLYPGSVGLEQGTDFLTLGNPGANNLRINFLSSDSPGDHFRVITLAPAAAGVPEPATWLTMIMGFGLLGQVLRRRRARRADPAAA